PTIEARLENGKLQDSGDQSDREGGVMTETTAAPAIDLLDPATFAAGHPHHVYQWLREHDPVHWHEERDGPGFWAVTRYDGVKAVGRDAETFSSVPTIAIADTEVF